MNDASEVKLHFLDYWRIIKIRAGLIALAFFLVMVTAGVTVYFLPRQYYSKVTMEVKPDDSGPVQVFDNRRGFNDPTFIPTQFQVLKKKQIIDPVIKDLDLVNKWSGESSRKLPEETVYYRLLGMLDLREVRNTGLIEIGVFSTDPNEAANIANTIAVVYKKERLSSLQDSIERGLIQLRDEVEKQRTRVEDAYKIMSTIREQDSIIDPDPESFGSNVSAADRDVFAMEAERNKQRSNVSMLEGQVESIKAMKPEEIREVLQTLGIQESSIFKMVTELQESEKQETILFNMGLGENHPRLKTEKAKQENFRENLSEALDSVVRNQTTLLNIQKRNLTDIEERLEVAKQYSIEDKKKVSSYVEAKSRYLQAKRIFDAAQVKLSTELLDKGIDFDPAKIWERAEPSLYPAKPNVPAYMTLAAVIGLIVGIGLAFFIEYLDTSVKTLDDVEKYLQIPVLAVIPKDVTTLIKTEGDTPDAEAYRILRANVEFNKPSRNANTFTLVSGGPGEGKSTTLNNLAFTCAQGGYNVLVVDADLRRPTQHRFFDIDNQVGLVDYLMGTVQLDEIMVPSKRTNLSFLPSGQLPGESVGILNSQRMVDLIAKVKKQYDLVFFDSPPILGVSDGSVLASECDATVMVVQHRRFPRSMLQRVKLAVANAGGRLIGVVLNNVDAKHDDGYSYYSNYSDYYATPREEKKKSETAPVPTTPRRTSDIPLTAPPPPSKVTTRQTLEDEEY